MTLKNKITNLSHLIVENIKKWIKNADLHVKRRLEEQKKEEIKFSPLDLALKYTVAFFLCAFIYWRLYFEEFNSDYFLHFFCFEDAPYILYYKGTFYAYFLLLSMLFSGIYLLRFANQYLRLAILLILLFIITYLSVTSGQFNIRQAIIFYGSTLIVTILYILYDKNAIYGYLVVWGTALTISAKNDANFQKKNPQAITLVNKEGKIVLNSDEKDRIFIGSTFKYYLIYNRRLDAVEKFSKDEIK